MELFKRLPSLYWRPKKDEYLVPPAVQGSYPALADDFALLEQELMPHFRALDNDALGMQNRFRLEQIILIFGGALATVLGAVQIALTNAIWPGISETVLTVILAGIARWAQTLNAQKRYFSTRLAAETLRGEYFRFLGRLDPYVDDNTRKQKLIRCVADVMVKAKGV